MSIVVFEHSDLAGADRLGRALRDHGHRLRVIPLHRDGAMPVDLDDVDGVIACGGGPSAGEGSEPWLPAEMDFLRAAHEAGRPVVGLCLGSQILGRALGGTVAPMAGGIELGWHPVTLTQTGCEDPLYAGIAWTSMQPQWHREEVAELPPGARALASSAACPHQAWAVGLRTYGFQYHPEIEPSALEAWAADDPQALDEAGTSLDELRQATEEHYPACARLADRLFESIALLLMPVDRRYRGLVKDLHH